MSTRGIIFGLIIILNIHPSLNLCIEHERQALFKIKKDIYDPDTWLSSWRNGSECCDWQGITCDNRTGHVISLDLQYPYDWSDDEVKKPNESKLNPSLVDLKHLTYLDLSNNNFFGASIPIFIGSLTRLEYLDLSSSGFKGTVPPQLGNLSSLQMLNIKNGYEPNPYDLRVDNLHWLSKLTSLTDLQMKYVDLSAASDWFHDITQLPLISSISFEYNGLSSIPLTMPPLNNFSYLQKFSLWGNELNSTIPSWLFYNISSLENLSLGHCGLYGELPLFSGQDSSLKYLNMPRNNFDGAVFRHLDKLPLLEELDLGSNNINASISKNLWNLTHLTSLDLSLNQIPGNLPKTLGNYTQLKKLVMSLNNLVGEIPPSIGNLFRLTDLFLSENNIVGKIPDSMGNLKKLNYMDVSTNLMYGEIPETLFHVTSLSSLILSNNYFSGRIPKSIANLNALNFLDLSSNKLSGSILFSDNQSSLISIDLSNNYFSGMLPSVQNITSKLVTINLSSNRFSGRIPNLFEFHPFLKSLQLRKNKLNGLLPSSLKYCKKLVFLDVSENKLYGKIPSWIGGELSSLRILNLRSNGFTGQIPKELSYLTSLQIMDLSQNYMTGNFSLYFDNFSVMTKAKNTSTIYFDNFSSMTKAENSTSEYLKFLTAFFVASIWLDNQGSLRQYVSTLSEAIVIDISNNQLSGEIPSGITKLIGLKFLNVSKNHFIGHIPKNIGVMSDLELLDLSSNDLSGEIPSTMTEMTSLSFVNLSNNNLSGEIPTGNQFGSFDDPSIYSGNKNLCGWPLQKCVRPINKDSNLEDEEHENWYDTMGIEAGAAVGFLISFCGIFVTLTLNQSVRGLHFSYVDKLYEWVCFAFYFSIAKMNSRMMETEMH